MGYNDLSECTLNAAEREAEKDRIVYRLQSCMDELTDKERNFVERISDESFVSVKQLFWLRDISDKY